MKYRNRALAITLSAVLTIISLISIATQGLVWGIDFTGGTLVEVGYDTPVEVHGIRSILHSSGFPDAVVQHFGTTKDVLIRLGLHSELKNEELSSQILRLLQLESAKRMPEGAVAPTMRDSFSTNSTTHDELATLTTLSSHSLAEKPPTAGPSTTVGQEMIHMRRVEFVGPQVGSELIEKGGLAILYTLIGILLYVAFRFEYRLAMGAILALFHDTIITVGVFSVFRLEFDDTVVVFDRIRDNFAKMRKQSSINIINASINQTLSRTIMTSVATLIVVVILLIAGGELIRGFSIALIVGITFGTYSSVYVASVLALILGVNRTSMMPVQKEGLPE
jgi:preprotein translocase subunit SecF